VTVSPDPKADAEIGLARRTLDAARLLAREGFHRDAVGRSYYSIFHAASALLASIGRPAKTHEGIRSLISEHFVRPGLLAPEHVRSLRQIAGDRTDADYDAVAEFSAEDSASDIARAEAFLVAAEQILARPPDPGV
jgi:uncharacterized protein (UPF0332 family)